MLSNLTIAIFFLSSAMGLQSASSGGRMPTFGELLRQHNIELTQAALVAALKNPEPAVRDLAAQQLAEDHVSTAIPNIVEALNSEQQPVTRMNIAFALAQLGEQLGFNTLEGNCSHENPSSRTRAQSAEYLLVLKHESSVCLNDMMELMRSEDSGYAMQAASILPKFQHLSVDESQRVFGALSEALTSPNPSMRAEAANAIALLGKEEGIRELQKAIAAEKDETLRYELQLSLERLKKKY